MGERCKLPHRGLGRSPRSQRFFALENAPKVRKKLRIQPLLIANTRCADHDLNIYVVLNSPFIHLLSQIFY